MSAARSAPPGPPGKRLAPLWAMGLALVVALRVIAAPLVIAAPEPGLIALCSGGQIIYVSLDGAPIDPDTKQPDRCPFLGVSLALADPTPEIPLPRRTGFMRLQVPAPATLLLARPTRANPPRAPPLIV